MKRVSVPITAATGVLLPTWALAQGATEPDRYYYGSHMMGWGEGWHGMFFGPLIMLLVLAAVVALVVLTVRWAGGTWPGSAMPHDRTPVDILKERLARGEIDKEDFEERRRVLGDTSRAQ